MPKESVTFIRAPLPVQIPSPASSRALHMPTHLLRAQGPAQGHCKCPPRLVPLPREATFHSSSPGVLFSGLHPCSHKGTFLVQLERGWIYFSFGAKKGFSGRADWHGGKLRASLLLPDPEPWCRCTWSPDGKQLEAQQGQPKPSAKGTASPSARGAPVV